MQIEQQTILNQIPIFTKTLPKEHEYRINYSEKNKQDLEITLKEGTAEIFGRELSKHKIEKFPPGSNFFIFTYSGCILELNTISNQFSNETFYDPYEIYGDPQEINGENTDNQMIILANISLFLSEIRQESLEKLKIGPNILICGSQQTGKNTISKILINYACKQGWTPIYSDLDITKNEILSGGMLGASQCLYSYPEDFLEHQNKILYFNGQTTMDSEKFEQIMYRDQVKILSKAINDKLEYDKEMWIKKNKVVNVQEAYKNLFISDEKRLFASGCVYNIPYLYNEYKNDLLDSIIQSCLADVIIVVEDDNLFKYLTGKYGKSKYILTVQKLKAVAFSDDRQKLIQKYNNSALNNYFKGKRMEISATSMQIPYNQITLFKIKTERQQTHIQEKVSHVVKAYKFLFQKEKIVKSVIGILHCQLTQEEQNDQELLTKKILESPLMILAHIENMNDEKQTMKILLPSSEYSEQLCLTKVWVIGNLTWTGIA